MPKMICTKKGYQILDDDGARVLDLSVKQGRPIYMHKMRNPDYPEQASIFLRGVIAALKPDHP